MLPLPCDCYIFIAAAIIHKLCTCSVALHSCKRVLRKLPKMFVRVEDWLNKLQYIHMSDYFLTRIEWSKGI